VKGLNYEFQGGLGIDPDEVIRAQSLQRAEPDTDESSYNDLEEQAARVPADVYSQIYELRRMFRL
jgi:hypothetical protein